MSATSTLTMTTRPRAPRLHPLFWPLMILALLCLINVYFNHAFFNIEIKSGHLYGSVIDILNRAAPLMLVAMGMTVGDRHTRHRHFGRRHRRH